MAGPIQAYFVCGGKWHDMDFARVELLKLLGEDPDIRTRVGEDFRDTQAIAEADFLVTYTCDLDVSDAQQQALAEFVQGGKPWFALHGTNSVFEFVEEGVGSPRTHQLLMRTLGSQFIAHPPIAPYTVTNAKPEHPLVKGIEPFEVSDELYLCEYHGEIEPLLETRFTGEATGFLDLEWPDDEPRLVMYLHPEGRGQVLYLTLGHCRGRYDMRPMMDVYPEVERGSWESPVFYELVRRGLRWASRGIDAV
ncbi:MAG: ThuA domain-containing protein [Proteobacteria bacterium]|nr:ThuA domain-containing protein [Pseudomonadota bacterium]